MSEIVQRQIGTHNWEYKVSYDSTPWPRAGKKPYNPYSVNRSYGALNSTRQSPPLINYPWKPGLRSWTPAMALESSRAYVKAYDSLMRKYGKTGPSAELGMTLIGARQSYNMILHRLVGLARSTNAFRKGDFVTAYQVLKQKPKQVVYTRKRKLGRKDAARLLNEPADLYLETIFGWQPLVQDIYNAVMVLCRDVEPHTLIGGGSLESESEELISTGADFSSRWLITGKEWVRLKATINVSNPNLELANRLGLVNPAVVLWDAVPGSFMLNWFANLQKTFARWTSQVGLSLTDISLTGGVARKAIYTYEGSDGSSDGIQTDETFVRRKLQSLGIPNHIDFTLPTRGLQGKAVITTALVSQNLTRKV